ncbi:MAG TPA: hypothetical protein VF125_04630 [Solirubrobacterales bacterium]
MAVMEKRVWTDERLDDLNARMEKGFGEVKGEVREVKGEVREVKGEVRELRKEMNTRFGMVEARFNSIEARLDGLNRSLVIGMVSMSASIVGALLVTQL